MKPLIALTISATKRYVRNISTLVFSLFVPLALILVFGAFINQKPSQFSLAIVDQNNSTESNKFIEGIKNISASKDGSTKLFKTDNLNMLSETEARQKLDKGDATIVMIIPKEFLMGTTPTSIQVLTSVNGNQDSQIALQVLSNYINQAYNYKNIPKTINVVPEQINTKNLTIIDFLVPGLIAQSIMQLGIFGVAFAFVSQKATGVLKRLLATPIKAWNIILAEGFARVIISILQIGILIGVSIFLYKLNIVGGFTSLLGVLVLALMGSAIFLSIGFAIAGYSKDENQVAPIAQVIQLPMLLLSGVFFSRSIFPDWLKTITDYFPLTFLSDGMRDIMNNGAGIEAVGKDIIGLAIWMIISFAIAYKLFKWE